MKTLRTAGIGDTVRVVKLHGEGAVKRRIMISDIYQLLPFSCSCVPFSR